MRTLPEDDPRLTPLSELFTYHIFGEPGALSEWQSDSRSYFLQITGLVERPMQLGLDDVRLQFEQVSAEMVLQCTTNVHWGRLKLAGARLLDVLHKAGLRREAVKVAVHGADGFDTDLLVSEIVRRPNAFLLAYAMNDEPIPPAHGFPLRLTADGKYGFKWCKWLTRLEVVDYDYRGHYEGRRRWSDAGERGRPVI